MRRFQVNVPLAGGIGAFYHHPEVTFIHDSGDSITTSESENVDERSDEIVAWFKKYIPEGSEDQFADDFNEFEKMVDVVKLRMKRCEHTYKMSDAYCTQCGRNRFIADE